MFRNFVIRALSGAAMAAILLGSIWYSRYSMVAILLVVAMLSLWEYLRNMAKVHEGVISKALPMVVGASLFVAISTPYTTIALSLAIVVSVVRCAVELFHPQRGQLVAIPTELLGIVYTVLPIALLAHIGEPLVITTIIFTVWANDVGAYLVGVTVGRHRMIEHISPKKSWEGFYGGLFFAVLVGGAMMHIYLNVGIWFSGVASLMVAVAAVVGDLFESMIKRRIGVKDSGSLIPGHGGMLDRFDALFFAVPVYYAVMKIVECFA